MQMIEAVSGILTGESDFAAGSTKFANLRKSADQALGRSAG